MNRERLEAFWYAVRPFVIYSILFMSVQAIIYRLTESVMIALHADMTVYYARFGLIADNLILTAAVTAALLPLLREGQQEISRVQKGRMKSLLYRHEDGRFLMMLLPVGTVSLAIALNILLMFFFGYSGGSVTADAYTGASLPLAAAVYGLLTPFAEELVYRGIMFARLRTTYSLAQSVLISAFIFGLSHGNMRQGIYGFIIGTVLAYSYEVSGMYAVPLTLHSMCNLTVLFMNAAGTFTILRSPLWAAFFMSVAVTTALIWCRKVYNRDNKV